MRRATMATSDLSNFYRPKKGKYRRRTDGAYRRAGQRKVSEVTV